MLKISADLSLPLDAVTQTFAFLAKRRVGKSYTIAVMAEEFVAARLPFVMIDPTGAHWGLRASSDGRGPGLPVVVIGGAHGDMPLDPDAGEVVADLVVDHPGYYVLDLSMTRSNAEQDRFCTAFAERLYRRKQVQRDPLHVFIDEADMVLPQRPQPNQLRMLGAYEALVRRGGIYGIGVSVVSQRPAICNKNVLSQVEVLVALQTTGPHDRKAIKEWAEGNGTKAQADELMASLASLERGEAWFWSPSWLGVFKKVKVRARRTFNSSATPKAGERAVEPKVLAAVDLDRLRAKLAATIEKARAEDPKALRARIAELERAARAHAVKIAGQEVRPPSQPPRVERVEVPILNDAHVKRFEVALCKAETMSSKTVAALVEVSRLLVAAAHKKQAALDAAPRVVIDPRMRPGHVEVRSTAPGGPTVLVKNVGPNAAQQRVLNALASLTGWGLVEPDKRQVALFAGQSPTSSGYIKNLSVLKSLGLVLFPRVGYVAITREGEQYAVNEGRADDGAMREAFLGRLNPPQAKILRALVEAHPHSLGGVELAERSAQSPTSSGFIKNVSTLSGLGVLDRVGVGVFRAAGILFLTGA